MPFLLDVFGCVFSLFLNGLGLEVVDEFTDVSNLGAVEVMSGSVVCFRCDKTGGFERFEDALAMSWKKA